MNAFAAIVGRYVGDIKNAMTVIMIVGVAGAVVMGFVWLFLLKKFARCMVWTIIFAVLILYVAVTLFLFVKAGTYIWISKTLLSITNTTIHFELQVC